MRPDVVSTTLAYVPIRHMVEDVSRVAQLLHQVYPDEPGTIHPAAVRLEWKSFVAEVDGAVVGFLLGTLFDYGLSGENHGTLVELVVDDTVRRRGIRRQLVDTWKAWLVERRVHVGFLLAAPDAVPFYQALGFVPTGGSYMIWSAQRDGSDLPRER